MFTTMIEQNDNFQTKIDDNNYPVNNLNNNFNTQTNSGILINENQYLDKIEYPNDFNKNEIDMYYTFKPHIKVFCYFLIFLTYYFILIYAVNSEKDFSFYIIYFFALSIYLTIFIIFINITYQIKITFYINGKYILFEEIGFCKVKSEKKNFNEVVSIRIKKLFHENKLNLEVINLDGLSIPLDIKCTKNCNCCQSFDIESYSSNFDDFIFICNCILEKCQKITNTFPCINEKLRLNDFYSEKAKMN